MEGRTGSKEGQRKDEGGNHCVALQATWLGRSLKGSRCFGGGGHFHDKGWREMVSLMTRGFVERRLSREIPRGHRVLPYDHWVPLGEELGLLVFRRRSR